VTGRRRLFGAALALLAGLALPLALTGAPGRAQSPAPAPAGSAAALPLRIVLSAATLAGLPRREVTVDEEHGGTATYSGVDLGAVLARAGLPQGEGMRGRSLAAYAVVVASDGYRVVFALPELDPAFTDRLVLLADRRNGQPLDATLAPYRIVVPGEKRHARWIRNAVEIDVEAVPPAGAGPPPAPANGSSHGT
jgi:hypothetical protein